MTQLQGSPFEFDQSNELHRKAQHYLETMDRDVFPTFGDVMITAIVDYFDRYYARQETDPGMEFSPEYGAAYPGDASADQALEDRIARVVEETLERKLPEIIGPMLEEMSASPSHGGDAEKNEEDKAEPVDLEAVEKEINWGFLGG